ncbi:hypothetical protein ACFSKU_08825 [Pontibacter silvestris]|uniref:Uncharacterized protein n=1 Tax=Pontibacter silvestris TaxID=2305183 RepID=A0ABW4WYN5_9BACT|nr:hypothetical protein [Pontibacter silvestris]MCC9138939.1 hypothetical protein [Pontibacter silvestris]
MNRVNKLITALYAAEQKNMQYSGGKARLFIAKLVFCLLIWIWLLPLLGILENNLGLIEISFHKPRHRIGYLPVLLVLYFILSYFTLRVEDADKYLRESENKAEMKSYRKWFVALIAIGFTFLIVVAKFNQGNPLSD